MSYKAPTVTDLGTLTELTQAVSFNGDEDGGSKMAPMHHSTPVSPPTSP